MNRLKAINRIEGRIKGKRRSQVAKELGISNAQVTRLLSGDYPLSDTICEYFSLERVIKEEYRVKK